MSFRYHVCGVSAGLGGRRPRGQLYGYHGAARAEGTRQGGGTGHCAHRPLSWPRPPPAASADPGPGVSGTARGGVWVAAGDELHHGAEGSPNGIGSWVGLERRGSAGCVDAMSRWYFTRVFQMLFDVEMTPLVIIWVVRGVCYVTNDALSVLERMVNKTLVLVLVRMDLCDCTGIDTFHVCNR